MSPCFTASVNSMETARNFLHKQIIARLALSDILCLPLWYLAWAIAGDRLQRDGLLIWFSTLISWLFLHDVTQIMEGRTFIFYKPDRDYFLLSIWNTLFAIALWEYTAQITKTYKDFSLFPKRLLQSSVAFLIVCGSQHRHPFPWRCFYVGNAIRMIYNTIVITAVLVKARGGNRMHHG